MGSTFGGLEIGKRGLVSHQTALNTTSHNISNADNPNYARQRVNMESMDPLYEPSLNRAQGPGQIGQGSMVTRIERVRDAFYDDQIIAATNGKTYWDAQQNYLVQMESIFAEPSDNTLRSLADKFWSSWQDLANYPSDNAHRAVVLERGNSLVTRIHDTHEKLQELRARANNEIVADVDRLNSLGSQVRDLNEKIMKLEALGDEPNDLKDKRDKVIEQMSEIANVRVGRGDRDEVFVFIGEQAFVQGEILRKLRADVDPANEGLARVAWDHNGRSVILGNGRLYSLLEMRDKKITERIDQINLFAVNLSDIVNEIHRDGFGLNGSTNRDFFNLKTLSPGANGNYQMQNAKANVDLNGDGQAELTAVFRVTGTNSVDPNKKVGVDGTITLFRNDEDNTPVRLDYRRDQTLQEIIKKINDSEAGVVAYMNHDNQLALKAVNATDDRRTNFMIRHLEDSGELLAGYTGVLNSSGEAGAFDFRRINEIQKLRAPMQDIALTPNFHPAAQLSLSADIVKDPGSIAAARGRDAGGSGDYNTPNGAADGSNALIIAASLKQDKKMFGHDETIEGFYNQLIAKLGTESRTAEDQAARQKENLTQLGNYRQSVMGVNMDEEMSNMVQFQQSYNASAKVINAMNEMIETLLRLGA